MNEKIVVIHLISADKQFHSFGAALTKARSPAAVLERGCFSIIALLVDRSSRRKICCGTFNQCSYIKTGDMCSCRGVHVMWRAAAFCSRCSRPSCC